MLFKLSTNVPATSTLLTKQVPTDNPTSPVPKVIVRLSPTFAQPLFGATVREAMIGVFASPAKVLPSSKAVVVLMFPGEMVTDEALVISQLSVEVPFAVMDDGEAEKEEMMGAEEP